jgi:outer membrane protein assembly factor BamB
MLLSIRRRLPAMGNLLAPVLALMASAMLMGCGGAVKDLLTDTRVMYQLDKGDADCKVEQPAGNCQDVKILAYKRHNFTSEFRPQWVEKPDPASANYVIDHVYRDPLPNGDMQLSVGFNAKFKPGVYTGTIELFSLNLDPFTEWLPTKIRYRLEIGSGGTTLLTPLPAVIPGRGDWSGFGGNGTRTGYVPVSLDVAKFNARWTRWIVSPVNSYGEGLHLAQGLIAVPDLTTGSGGVVGNATVMSLKDGADLWKGVLPEQPSQVMGQGDRLYWGAQSGRVMVTSTTAATVLGDHAAKGNTQVAPGWTFAGGRLLMPTDPEVNYLSALDVSDIKTPVWTTTLTDRIVGANFVTWGVTADANAGVAYVNAGGVYRVVRLSDGAIQAEAQVPTRENLAIGQVATYQAPVLPDDGVSAILLSHRELVRGSSEQNHLTVVDRATGAQRWDVSGQFMDHPVTAHGVVYVSNQFSKAVEARSLADGTLLWTWAMPSGDSYWQRQMVLTDTHLFVSTDQQTVAIDLATRIPVWQVPQGGWIGMTPEGVLVLLTPDGGYNQLTVLRTFNLR